MIDRDVASLSGPPNQPSLVDLSVVVPGGGRRHRLEMVTLGWVFGAVWLNATSGAPLTLFAKGLGASNLQFGVLTAMPFIASLLSVPGSLLIEWTGERKSIFLKGLYTQRFLWFPIALVPIWIVSRYGMTAAPTAMLVLMGLFFLMHASGAAGGPAWVSWMADVVPHRVRGKFFARRRQWGILTAIPAALAIGYFLDRGAGASNPLATLRLCALIFLAAAVFGVADIGFFQRLPHDSKPRQSGRQLLCAMAEPIRNKRFMLFSTFVGFLMFTVSLLNQFATLYLIEKVKIGNTGTQLMLLVAPMLAQLLVLPLWGEACDRIGKRPVVALAAIGMIPMGFGWSLLTTSHPMIGYVLSAAGTALWTGIEVANFNLTIEMSGADRKRGGSAYVAVNNVIINVAGCLGGLAAGVAAQTMKDWTWQPIECLKTFSFYDVLFFSAGVLRVAAVVVVLPLLHEPSGRGAVDAFVFIRGRIRGSLDELLELLCVHRARLVTRLRETILGTRSLSLFLSRLRDRVGS